MGRLFRCYFSLSRFLNRCLGLETSFPFVLTLLVLHASIYESDQKFSTGKDNKSSSEPHDLFIRSSFDSGVIRKNAFIN